MNSTLYYRTAILICYLLSIRCVCEDNTEMSRKLAHHNIYTVQHTVVGNRHLVKNITIYGAVITGGHPLDSPIKPNVPTSNSSSSLSSHADIIAARMQNVRQLQHLLPFPLVEWPPIFTKPCPQFSHGHKTERGVALAHYQIWLDFIFFDNDILDARQRPKPEYLTSNSYSSISGKYTAYENGTLFKDDVPFKDEGDSQLSGINSFSQ